MTPNIADSIRHHVALSVNCVDLLSAETPSVAKDARRFVTCFSVSDSIGAEPRQALDTLLSFGESRRPTLAMNGWPLC